MTDATPDEIIREATLVAVDMEIHAALSTTTRAKAEVIARALMARDKRAAEIARKWEQSSWGDEVFAARTIADAILTYEASNAK